MAPVKVILLLSCVLPLLPLLFLAPRTGAYELPRSRGNEPDEQYYEYENAVDAVDAVDEVDEVGAEFEQCAHQGHLITEDLYAREESLGHSCQCQSGSPEYLHYANHKASPDLLTHCKASFSVLMATRALQRELEDTQGIAPHQFGKYLAENSHHFQAHANCQHRPVAKCREQDIYRRLDGSCNNLKFPTWGQARTALERLLPAKYADGVYSPRKSVKGKPLPSARVISRTLYKDRQDALDRKLTQAFMLFGQFLSHEFSLTLPAQTYKGGINCCSKDGSKILPTEQLHHACFPIYIPSGDHFYTKYNQRCMNFVRSMITTKEDCSMGAAEQLNVVTSYLDLSPLYGNDKPTSDSLRTFYSGKLLVSKDKGRDVLPLSHSNSSCDLRDPREPCYASGDQRGNQNPQLTAFHIILLREHNALAEALLSLNPHWDDEKVFQEARRLLIAVIQQITYYEWLPLLIDKSYLERHHILHTDRGLSDDYSEKVNAGTLNEYTAGAYRYLHSTIISHPGLVAEDRHQYDRMWMKNTFNRPSLVTERLTNYDGLLRGLTSNAMMETDNHFSHVITQYLFAGKKPFGQDLISLDIQRGRDHGLDSYIKYRKVCGLSPLNSFSDLASVMSQERINSLRKLYADVRDIDFFVGAIAENHAPGSILGPTIQCIVGEQFYRWRVGDRFFFESSSNPLPFSPAQLGEIRKSSLARLLCDNSDNVQTMQPKAFRQISASNPLVSCEGSDIPKINLRPWKE